jgi:hypothetical protein
MNSPTQVPPDELFTGPEAPCCLGQIPGESEDCPGCPKEERALRAIIAGQYRPMTGAERDYCKREIAAVEGYSEADAEGSDADVARTVLSAWQDYCRDKGML